MPNRPGKGLLNISPRRRSSGGLFDLLSSDPSLKVNEGVAESNPDTGELIQGDPTFTGERAKLFGFIPYGPNPADEVNNALAYEQISGNAANQRQLNLQKLLGSVLLNQALETETILGPEKNANELSLFTGKSNVEEAAKQRAAAAAEAAKQREAAAAEVAKRRNLRLENKLAIRKQRNLDASEVERERRLFYAKQGAEMSPESVALANAAMESGLLNRGTEADQAGIISRKTFKDRADAAAQQAQRAAIEAAAYNRAASSKPGQTALGQSYLANQLKSVADVLATSNINLAPGQVSQNPLAEVFGLPSLSLGAIPREEPIMATIIGKDGRAQQIPTGNTTKSLSFPIGSSVTPEDVARAAENLKAAAGNRGTGQRTAPGTNVVAAPTPAVVAPPPAPRIVTPSVRGLFTQPSSPALDSRQNFNLPDISPLPTDKQSKATKGKQRNKPADFSALVSGQLPLATDTVSREAMKTREQRISELIESAKLERARTGVGRTSREMTGPEGNRQTILNEIKRLEKSKRTAAQEDFLQSLKTLVSEQ